MTQKEKTVLDQTAQRLHLTVDGESSILFGSVGGYQTMLWRNDHGLAVMTLSLHKLGQEPDQSVIRQFVKGTRLVTGVSVRRSRVELTLNVRFGNPNQVEKLAEAVAAELTARVDALMRRSGGSMEEHSGEISQPPFLLNTRNRTLEKNGKPVKLTQVEYSIMRMFMENPGKALSREEILDLVWGRDYFGELKIVDVNIRRLRLKIEDNATNPTFISTVWGYGYKWDA